MNFAQVKTIVDKDEEKNKIKDTTLNQEQKLAQSENLGKALLSQLKKEEEAPQHKKTTKKKTTQKKKDDKDSKDKK